MNGTQIMEELHLTGGSAPENAKKGRIYISGAISGRPIEEARAQFQETEDRLQAEGWETVNPLKNGLPEHAPWSAHMAVDILSLLGCDALFLLPGWEESQGATIEAGVARLTGKAIYRSDAADYFAGIKWAIRDALGITPADLCGDSRDQRVVFARMIFARQAKDAGASFPEIGRAIRHHHTTVIYWLKRYPTEYQYTPEFRKMADKVSEFLKNY